MKKALLYLCPVVALACSLASTASAALPDQFVTSDPSKTFSIEQARKITFQAGYVQVVSETGADSYSYLPDTTGSVAAKIKASARYPALFVESGNVAYAPSKARWIVCANSQTVIGWAQGQSETLSDGCSLFQLVRAQSN